MYRFATFFLLSITLSLSLGSCRSKSVTASRMDQANTRVDSTVAPDPAMDKMVAQYRGKLQDEMNQVVGSLETNLDKGQPECTLGNFVVDVIQSRTSRYLGRQVDFSIVNDGGLRVNSIAAGPLKKQIIYELMPFDNALVVLELKGSAVKELFDLMAVKGGWPISKGSSYTIKNQKAVDISINGSSLDPERKYLVGMSDYLANGGDNCTMFEGAQRFPLEDHLLRDAILDYTMEQKNLGKPINARIEGRVRRGM